MRKRASARRTHRAVVLLTHDELYKLQLAARRAGMTLSTWLRWLGLQRADKA